jgi:hypothetical protein
MAEEVPIVEQVDAQPKVQNELRIFDEIPFKVVFAISQAELNRLSEEEKLELLAFKALHKDKIHILISATAPNEPEDRIQELRTFGKVYFPEQVKSLPPDALVIDFGRIEAERLKEKTVTALQSRAIDARFAIAPGAFGTALLYAYADGDLPGLSQKDGYLYDAQGLYTSQILSRLFQNYVVISTSA